MPQSIVLQNPFRMRAFSNFLRRARRPTVGDRTSRPQKCTSVVPTNLENLRKHDVTILFTIASARLPIAGPTIHSFFCLETVMSHKQRWKVLCEAMRHLRRPAIVVAGIVGFGHATGPGGSLKEPFGCPHPLGDGRRVEVSDFHGSDAIWKSS